MDMIDIILKDMSFLSDVFEVENNESIFYVPNESSDPDLENVIVIINFVKPVISCHQKEKTGFANINRINR